MANNSIEERLRAIERRNQRVELDKGWETSFTRRFSIAALTYLTVLSFLLIIGNDSPAINALVPVGGFVLSTLTMGKVRALWQKRK